MIDPFVRHLDLVCASGVLLDRGLTLFFWEYEANPLVLELGYPRWVILSVLGAIALVIVWRVFKLWRVLLTIILVAALALLTYGVVFLNLLGLLLL